VVQTTEDATIVRPVGELDLATSAEFEAVLERVADQHVIVDLRELSFMGSTGIAALLRSIERVGRAGGTIELVPGRPGVQRVFELTGLSERLPFAPVTPR
jgi:stage II sporulation protein AA (anti-sigma F factor antagonist)